MNAACTRLDVLSVHYRICSLLVKLACVGWRAQLRQLVLAIVLG